MVSISKEIVVPIVIGSGLALLPRIVGGRLGGIRAAGLALVRKQIGEHATIKVTIKNTSPVSYTFWVGCTFQDPNGTYHDLSAKSVTVASGATADVTFDALGDCITHGGHAFNVVGNWHCRVSVWDVQPVPGTGEEHRKADTGWYMNLVECYEITVQIVAAYIDTTKWYP